MLFSLKSLAPVAALTVLGVACGKPAAQLGQETQAVFVGGYCGYVDPNEYQDPTLPTGMFHADCTCNYTDYKWDGIYHYTLEFEREIDANCNLPDPPPPPYIPPDPPAQGGGGDPPAGGTSTTAESEYLAEIDALGATGLLCDFLEVADTTQHLYFFGGMDASGSVMGTGKGVGVDFVYDYVHLQIAAFSYGKTSGCIGTCGSASVGAYEGIAFSMTAPNVLAAWSGRFDGGTLNISIPETKFGVEGSLFSSPDQSVYGLSLGATAGINPGAYIPFVNVAADDAVYKPFNEATAGMAALHGLPLVQTSAGMYIQCTSYSQFAMAIQTGPFRDLTASMTALTIGLLKSTGLDAASLRQRYNCITTPPPGTPPSHPPYNDPNDPNHPPEVEY